LKEIKMSEKLEDWEKCECGHKATKRFFELDENFELVLHPVCEKCYSGETNKLINSTSLRRCG